MRSARLHILARAAALALACGGLSAARAQSGPAPADARAAAAKPDEAAQAVTVTGIRASTERSLEIKREAVANVDVITAVDVGKMPDKNLADSLQRIVGVAVRTDYDEAEKVSLRGTNPDMTLILFNGHTVSGGDWYISDQLSSSRSTSLSLMPSSVLNSATVYKSSQANIVDGGLAGTVNVTTRKPLNEKQAFGGVVSLGAVHATLPGRTSPQLNASLNWKNEANTFGVIAQLFSEKRYVRRDSVSRFAYGASSGWDVINTATMLGITDASLAGTPYKAADLQGVRLPGSMSTEFVEGVRDREGGMVSLQFRPSRDVDVGLTGFTSKMNSENYGRLTSSAIYSMLAGKAEPFGSVAATAANTNSNGQRVYAQIRNPVIVEQTTIYGHTLKVLKAADIVFPSGTTPQYVGNSEGFFRSGASASSSFLDLDLAFRASDVLTLKALLSGTRGVGTTALDRGLTYARYGTGIRYAFAGLHDAPSWQYLGAGDNRPVRNADGSGYQLISRSTPTGYTTIDKEQSLAVDGEWALDHGWLTTLDFGARFADHRRDHRRRAPAYKGPTLNGPDPALAVSYPGDFGAGMPGDWDRSGFYFPAPVMRDFFASQTKPTTPEFERRVAAEIEMRERQTAAYAMQNFEAPAWKLQGNVGLRIVETRVDAQIATPVSATICPRIEPGKPVVPCAAFPTAINTAGDGATYFDGVPFNPNTGTVYYKVPTTSTFTHVLPSVNLRAVVAPQWIARLGVNKTVGRQNYNLYGAGFTGQTCGASGCTVNGPNPSLEPMTANNVDASLAWHFARRSLAQVSLFSSKIRGYPKTGAVRQDVTVDLVDPATNQVRTYSINTASQQGARIHGVEFGYEQPIGAGFGFNANASLATTRVDDGRPMVGASKKAANLGLYYEDDRFSARLVWNYRGEYVSSTTAPAPTANSQGQSVINGVAMPTAPFMAAPVTNVALSLNYQLGPVQLSFNATNLTNPVRATYRYSEAEQQKLDISGRQYYLEARYKY